MAASFAELVLLKIEDGIRMWVREWDYSITQNFLQGGRPTAWKKTRRGGKILQKTNRMHTSIDVKYERTGETLFTMKATVPVKYGRIHQYGGWIRPRKAKALAIPLTKEAREKPPRSWPKSGDGSLFKLKTKKGTVFLARKEGKRVVKHFVLLTAVYIPGRPYLVIQDDDRASFRRIIKGAVQAAKADRALLSSIQ